jgi:hypothetical protein
MKTTYAILTAALAIGMTAATMAQDNGRFYITDSKSYSTQKIDKAAKNYMTSLNMDNEGVVESALAQVAAMKLVAPAMEFSALREKVAGLVTSGRTPSVRYKASLALMVFENPEMFREVRNSQYEDSDQFFIAVAQRIQESLFAGSF